MRRFEIVLAVFVGGCLGGLARYAEVRAWPTGTAGFPWSTLVVNLTGAFILAAFVTWARRAGHAGIGRALVGTGFCGAYTTFSSIVVDADRLLARGSVGTALGYLAASFAGGLAAAFIGMFSSAWVHSRASGLGAAP
jgi:CrcB protein